MMLINSSKSTMELILTKENEMNLDFTGERLVPNKVDKNDPLYVEHISRYIFSENYVSDKVILDAGCGCGYGSNLLAKTAKKVTGIDISDGALSYCKEVYKNENLEFKKMDCCEMSFEKNSFDLITSFEFIEHVTEQSKFINEIIRVLKNDGIFIVSTPNKDYFNSFADREDNPFHSKELSFNEFEMLLKGQFKKVVIYGQKISDNYIFRKKNYELLSDIRHDLNFLSRRPFYSIFKSLIPSGIRSVLKKSTNKSGNEPQKTGITRHLVPLSINDVEISTSITSDAYYYIAVCRK